METNDQTYADLRNDARILELMGAPNLAQNLDRLADVISDESCGGCENGECCGACACCDPVSAD